MNKYVGGGFLLLLCIVVLAACGRSSQAKTAEVQITLSDFRIASSLMAFIPGVPYHFTVTNRGKTAHELILMSSMMKTMPMSGMPMSTMEKMALTAVGTMKPGETRTFDYTFVSSTAGPHPELSCRLPGHYEAGMRLDVTVGQEKPSRSPGGAIPLVFSP
ncbi:MAG: hypothetical protein J2P37_11615 [Ktedonobacteraceae bacterium]|nr:hypothetical protein [Ktedonobacteraceae bacterium]